MENIVNEYWYCEDDQDTEEMISWLESEGIRWASGDMARSYGLSYKRDIGFVLDYGCENEIFELCYTNISVSKSKGVPWKEFKSKINYTKADPISLSEYIM